jgi:23S rRNA pseudouridine1911/1915/1917 synthase
MNPSGRFSTIHRNPIVRSHIMIELLLADPWFLVLNKPIDLLTQAPPHLESVQRRLVEQLAPSMPATPFIGIPHRLDRMTSGAMVVARNQRALRRLCDQFASRKVLKEYIAWVHGSVPEQGEWVDTLRKVPDEPRAEVVDAGNEDGRLATLSYRLVHTMHCPDGTCRSLVRIALGTGRMHQIRLQFGSRGHSIIGDALYGSACLWGDAQPTLREPPIALHAFRIGFHHPKNGEFVSVHALPPAEFPWQIEPEMEKSLLCD